MNTEDFVTYEQALVLKRLGFEEEVNHYYQEKKLIESLADYSCEEICDDYNTAYENLNGHWIPEEIECSAPTLAQVQKWLRKEKNIIVESIGAIFIPLESDKVTFIWRIFNWNEPNYMTKVGNEYYQTPEKALSAGITECLKLLENE